MRLIADESIEQLLPASHPLSVLFRLRLTLPEDSDLECRGTGSELLVRNEVVLCCSNVTNAQMKWFLKLSLNICKMCVNIMHFLQSNRVWQWHIQCLKLTFSVYITCSKALYSILIVNKYFTRKSNYLLLFNLFIHFGNDFPEKMHIPRLLPVTEL